MRLTNSILNLAIKCVIIVENYLLRAFLKAHFAFKILLNSIHRLSFEFGLIKIKHKIDF